MLAVKNELCLLQIERKYIREKSLMLTYRKLSIAWWSLMLISILSGLCGPGEEPPAPRRDFISAFLPTIASGLFRFPLMLQKAALSVDDPIP